MIAFFTRNRILVVIVFMTCLLTSACASGPRIGEHAVTTSTHYAENKVLFAIEPEQAVLADSVARRSLKHTYELDGVNAIEALEPLGVIIRGVRLPEELSERRDVAVILDVVTAGSESVTSIVAFYQRDVPGGQMLNFQDLLVYYDPEWDGATPPWFRVRVMDVKSERNRRTRAFLDEANKLSGSLAGIVPHPVLPSVRTAVEAAKLVLGNKKNEIIVDYQVQFYSPAQIKGADVKLTPLRKGEWLVVGRVRGGSSSFWNQHLQLDARTGEIYSSRGPEQVPYVSLALMSADASVPKHIMDRSLALIQQLDSPTERVNFDALASSVSALNSAVRGYTLVRRLKKYHSNDDLRDLIDLLKEYQADNSILQTAQARSLVRMTGELADESFGGVKEVLAWWSTGTTAAGTFCPVSNNKIIWKSTCEQTHATN